MELSCSCIVMKLITACSLFPPDSKVKGTQGTYLLPLLKTLNHECKKKRNRPEDFKWVFSQLLITFWEEAQFILSDVQLRTRETPCSRMKFMTMGTAAKRPIWNRNCVSSAACNALFPSILSLFFFSASSIPDKAWCNNNTHHPETKITDYYHHHHYGNNKIPQIHELYIWHCLLLSLWHTKDQALQILTQTNSNQD